MSELPIPSADTISRQKMLAETVVATEKTPKQSDEVPTSDSNSSSDQPS